MRLSGNNNEVKSNFIVCIIRARAKRERDFCSTGCVLLGEMDHFGSLKVHTKVPTFASTGSAKGCVWVSI